MPLTLAAARSALFKYGSNVDFAVATAAEKLAVDAILNQVQERFIQSGKPRLTLARARIVVYDYQITLPASLETVLKAKPIFINADNEEEGCCCARYGIYNGWYDISTNERGNVDDGCIPGLVDLGEQWPTFRTPDFDFKIRPVPRLTEVNTGTILLRGLNGRGEEVFSSTATQGEAVTMHSTSNVTSSWTFSRLTSWVKSMTTNGIVDLFAIPQDTYEDLGPISSIENLNEATIDVLVGVPASGYVVGDKIRIGTTIHTLSSVTVSAALDARYSARLAVVVTPNFGTILPEAVTEYLAEVTTETQTLIASIFPGELVSGYRRYAVPNLEDGSIVQCLCKRAYVPSVSDNDIVIPSNLGALKLAMMALQYEDKNDWDRSDQYWNRAFALLEQDRQEFDGDSALPTFNFAGDFGAGSIVNVM